MKRAKCFCPKKEKKILCFYFFNQSLPWKILFFTSTAQFFFCILYFWRDRFFSSIELAMEKKVSLLQILILISNSNHILFLDFLFSSSFYKYIYFYGYSNWLSMFFLLLFLKQKSQSVKIFIIFIFSRILFLFFLHETSICMIKYSHHKILSILNVWPFANVQMFFLKKKKNLSMQIIRLSFEYFHSN